MDDSAISSVLIKIKIRQKPEHLVTLKKPQRNYMCLVHSEVPHPLKSLTLFPFENAA